MAHRCDSASVRPLVSLTLAALAALALSGCDPAPPSVRGAVDLAISLNADGSASTKLVFDDTRTREEPELVRVADEVAQRLFTSSQSGPPDVLVARR